MPTYWVVVALDVGEDSTAGLLLLIASNVYPPELARQMVAKRPQGHLLRVANHGHFLHHEMQGEEFAGLIKSLQDFFAAAS